MKGIVLYMSQVCVSHKSNYISFVHCSVSYCIVHPFIFHCFYYLPLVRKNFLVKYIAGSTVIKLWEKGTLFQWPFLFRYLFIFIYLFIYLLCNLYHLNVISGKFMFLIVLNSVKKTRHFPIWILGKFHCKITFSFFASDDVLKWLLTCGGSDLVSLFSPASNSNTKLN
jgi:hypothetical protein